MRILMLERTLASAIVYGARSFANLWLLPAPSMVGQRIGIAGESIDDNWWHWLYLERLRLKIPHVLKPGVMGSVKLERVAAPGELGRGAFGPAVWVFSDPKLHHVEGKIFRAGYSEQPHVVERDKLNAGLAQKEKESGADTV